MECSSEVNCEIRCSLKLYMAMAIVQDKAVLYKQSTSLQLTLERDIVHVACQK